MKRYYLTRLAIEGFRGINNEGQPLELRFDANKVNSIYALNGLGKSSIYDALCYAILGNIPKLDQLERTEDAASYISNRFHSTGTATIELTFSADDGTGETVITVVRSPNGQRTTSSPTEPDPDSFLSALRSDFVLLDQDTFARFIRDKSLERGRTFSRLLGLSSLSECRGALQKLANAGNIEADFGFPTLRANEQNWKQEQEQAVIRLRKAYDQLTGQPYTGDLKSETYSNGVLAALKQIPTVKPFCDVASLDEIKFDEVEAAVSEAEKNVDRDRLFRLREARTKLTAQSPAGNELSEQEALEQAIKERDEALALTSGELLKNNYLSAVAVLESEEWDDATKCPTCEEKQPTSLLESLLRKLNAYEDAKTAGGKIKTAWQSGSWVKRLRDLEANERVKPVSEARDHARLAANFTAGSATISQFEEAKNALAKLELARLGAISSLNDEITKLEKSLPASMVQVTTQVATGKQAAADLASFEQRRPQLELVRRRIARREAWQSFIQKAYGDFSDAESKWVSNRQAAIATDYQKMHDQITRNPDVVPSLDRPTTSERLRLGLDRFYGLEDLSATPLLQESYCNAVAISTFLSTALLCPTPARFIVLDDVTSSFDGGHQYNLMELLRTSIIPSANANGLEIILLTHDTLLEKYLDKATQTGSWRHQKLIGTPPNGPVLTEQHNKDRVRQRAADFLSAGQIESASPWIRQYLEATLTQIIRKTGIRVPLDYAMDDSKKMPQNALNAIADEIDLYRRAGTLVLTAQQVTNTNNTLVPSLVSNFLSHYNTGAFAGITSHVLLGVLNDIDALAECFKYDCTCSQPGRTVRRFYRSLTAKACSC